MSGATGVVHEAGVPRRPSISTRHSRQEPKGSRLSEAHSFGTMMPSSAAARMIDVPSGTVTVWPSISHVTIAFECAGGVPKSFSLMSVIGWVSLVIAWPRIALFIRRLRRVPDD